MMTDPLLIDAAGAADTLGVSERTIWRLTAPRGPLPCIRIGRSVRYAINDLRRYVDTKRCEPVRKLIDDATARGLHLTTADTLDEEGGIDA